MTSLTAANATTTPILCSDDDEWVPIVKNSADKKTPFVVAFGAGWCGPCKVLKPVFRSLAKEWTAKDPANAPIFVEVDVDEGQLGTERRVAVAVPSNFGRNLTLPTPAFIPAGNSNRDIDGARNQNVAVLSGASR